jgi:hypothetical protein
MEPSQDLFDCRMCGQCCYGEGGIIVSSRDLDRLGRLLGLEAEEVRRRYCQPSGGKTALQCDTQGYCIFFTPGAGCQVHSHKPDICAAWPFFRGNLEDEASLEMAKDFCPGIGRDIGHAEFIRQGLAYLIENDLLRPEDPEAPNALRLDPAKFRG